MKKNALISCVVICAIVFEYAGFLKTLLISADFKNSMFLYMDPISEESVEILFPTDLLSSSASLCFHHMYKLKYK